MAETETRGRLTIWEAIKDLGWFSLVFTTIVGGPSILSILQSTFEFHLTDILQWIVEGYDQAAGFISRPVELLMLPLLDWLNSTFKWSLVLNPLWRPLFFLMMIFATASARADWHNGYRLAAVLSILVNGFPMLIGALLAGLVPLDGGWWAQGFLATIPLLMSSVGTILQERSTYFFTLGFVAQCVVPFAIGATISFVPGLALAAGVLTVAVLVCILAISAVAHGVIERDATSLRIGLSCLGGFVFALVVLVSDVALKAL